jgi:hypothetical protein
MSNDNNTNQPPQSCDPRLSQPAQSQAQPQPQAQQSGSPPSARPDLDMGIRWLAESFDPANLMRKDQNR